MAVIEQLIYGANPETGQPGRYVLARSPGLSKDIATEIVRLCEGWGGAPQEENFQPVLVSLPLKTQMRAISGRLFAIIQVSSDPLPIFHAVVISEVEFNTFNCNPFALALEEVFLRKWAPGLILERREIRATSLAPLVSPLPTESDADLIEEAVRQVLTNDKLLLPLEINDAQSDRFLTLLMCALPLQVKRSLRFASLATSEVNGYHLAAIYRPGNSIRNWHRYLMAAVSGPISSRMKEYLAAVRTCVANGDLLGLEKVSRQSLVNPGQKTDAPPPVKTEKVAATLGNMSQELPPERSQKLSAIMTAAPQPATATRKRPTRRPKTRRRPTRRRTGRKVSGWLMATVCSLLVVAGAGYWLSLDNWHKVTALLDRGDNKDSSPTLLGVIDVGALYNSQLHKYLQAGIGTPGPEQEKLTAKGLTALRVDAAEDLNQQGLLFANLVAQGIYHHSSVNREAERLNSLAQRGTVLEQEIRRLHLAYFAIESGVLWHDLADLSDREMNARWDSLRGKHPDRLESVAENLGMKGLLADVRYAGRQMTGMAGLVEQFAKNSKDEHWIRATENAAKDLTLRSLSPSAMAYRACAVDLVGLKKAEEVIRFSRLAYVEDYEKRNWLPDTLAKNLAKLRKDIVEYGADSVPPLIVATIDFYNLLLNKQMNWSQASPAELSDLIKAMEKNKAVVFDPAQYADHVDRVRFAALEGLLKRQYDPRKLPVHFFPGQDRAAAHAFRALILAEPSGDEWQEVSKLHTLPFYVRWAQFQAGMASQAKAQNNSQFDLAYADITETVANLTQQVRQGQDWTDTHLRLQKKLEEVRNQYSGNYAGDTVRQSNLANLADLTTALDQPLNLALTAVTVRLDQPLLTQASEVSVEIVDENGRLIEQSRTFSMGPAAPAGSGWVGTLSAPMDLALKPGQNLRVLVRDVGTGRNILTCNYNTTDARVPAALAQAHPGHPPASGSEQEPGSATGGNPRPRGSVAFKITDGHWRQLKLPSLGSPLVSER